MHVSKDGFRIITATDENPIYIHFWPSMAKNWTDFYGIKKITLGFITERSENDPLVVRMKQYGDVVLFKPIIKINRGIQAKITRLFLSAQYKEDYCIITDIDMYILNKKETWPKWFSQVKCDKLLCVGANYGEYNHPGRSFGAFPMAFTTAKSVVFEEIINPNNLDYESLVGNWRKDSKTFVGSSYNKFSDEYLLKLLVLEWKKTNIKLAVRHPDILSISRDFKRRIDRLAWNINMNQLEKGHYLDCQPLRPLPKNLNKIKPILNYLHIDQKDWLL